MVKGIGVDLVDIRRFVPRKEEYAQKILISIYLLNQK